jgi:hypothetical protein
MEVANIEVDLYEFHPSFQHYYVDLQVIHEFIDNRHYKITVRRLDNENEGWSDNVRVLVNYIEKETTEIILIGSSIEYEKYVFIETDFDIQCSDIPVHFLDNYTLSSIPNPIPISRTEFNIAFDTDLVMLSHNLYAFGVKDKQIFIYNEKYASYNEMIFSANFILKCIFTYLEKETPIYFILCSDDGYLEKHYFEKNRNIPRKIEEEEFRDFQKPNMKNVSEYPIFHKKKWIMGHSCLRNVPYTIGIPDRHFFYCNLYNPFRSFHRGIPFYKKRNKIVFGCRKERGDIYNYTVRRDININQRTYFYSNEVCKDNIYYTESGWIPDKEMVNYKYILDVDGNASTWDATAWKLNSGSVIFKTDGPWQQWFYDEYVPWIHYIPIQDDFSDLQEKYKWCEEHPKECEEMIFKCKRLFQQIYRVSNLINYVKSTVLYINSFY